MTFQEALSLLLVFYHKACSIEVTVTIVYLAEAPKHDPVGRHPSLELLRHEDVHEAGGALDAGLVLAAVRVEAEEIKPGRHLEAGVEGHRHLVCCGADHFNVWRPEEKMR